MQRDYDSLRQLEHHIDDSIRLYRNQEADDYPAHWHSAAELILPVENDYTVVVGETAHHIQSGELFMVPPGVVHEIFAPEDGFRYLFMVDQREFFSIQGLAKAGHMLYPCVHIRQEAFPQALPEIRGFFERAVAAYEGDSPLAPAVARLWLGLVLVRVTECLLTGGGRDNPPVTRRQHEVMAGMMHACGYINEHCASKLALEDVAAACGYSKYHFARIFKTYTGMSFYDYYMRQRMVLCRRLLSDPSLPVTEVALRAGFDSIATFNRVFKHLEGVTPSQYRRMQQSRFDS